MSGANELKPAVFLDRDGTLNVEKEYLHRIEDWEWIPGAVEAIRKINRMGWLAIVVTNQAGVARGYYAEGDVRALHGKVDNMLAAEGAHIDGYYYCPHHAEYGETRNCACRKPAPGMLLAAQRDFGIDLSHSYMIGDKALDVEAALRAGVTPVLVMTGYGAGEQSKLPEGTKCAPDVLGAVEMIGIANQNMT
jgi:D-glycero-D-manno-heptose 1,7-bisphosphate phosphatase